MEESAQWQRGRVNLTQALLPEGFALETLPCIMSKGSLARPKAGNAKRTALAGYSFATMVLKLGFLELRYFEFCRAASTRVLKPMKRWAGR